MCCQRKFVPLKLAWASTIHKLQGTTYGPSKPGEPKNPGETLIVDVGPKSQEKTHPGLAYVAISRGTSMRSDDLLNSAIYFVGQNFSKNRLTNMSMLEDGKRKTMYSQRRENWIKHLNNNVHEGLDIEERQQRRIMEWATAETSRLTKEQQVYFKENVVGWEKKQ